jgi:hypothetical protein
MFLRGPRPYVGTRLRRLVHQPLAGGVLAVGQLQCISRGIKSCRQSVRQGQCHGAAVALERDQRPAVARREDVLFNCCFKSIVMCSHNP